MTSNYEYPTPDWLRYVLIALAVMMLGYLLTGCTTLGKATRYFDGHGFQAARYCAAAFPVKSDTTFIPGKEIHTSDTTILPGDSIPCPDQKPGEPPAKVKCPPSVVIHDTARIQDTLRITKENPAKDSIIAGQHRQITEQGIRLQIAQAKASHRGKLMWGTWIVLALLIGGYFFAKSRTALLTGIIDKLKNKL